MGGENARRFSTSSPREDDDFLAGASESIRGRRLRRCCWKRSRPRRQLGDADRFDGGCRVRRDAPPPNRIRGDCARHRQPASRGRDFRIKRRPRWYAYRAVRLKTGAGMAGLTPENGRHSGPSVRRRGRAAGRGIAGENAGVRSSFEHRAHGVSTTRRTDMAVR